MITNIPYVIAQSPSHFHKFLSYICQAPAWDGKSHFSFSSKSEKAVRLPAASMRSLSANFAATYPNADPLEFIRVN